VSCSESCQCPNCMVQPGETDWEGLIPQLESAGFKEVGICSEFYELKVGDVCIGVPVNFNGVCVKRGRKIFDIPCKDFAASVRLALAIKEATEGKSCTQ
jgi:hypothetical protein